MRQGQEGIQVERLLQEAAATACGVQGPSLLQPVRGGGNDDHRQTPRIGIDPQLV